MKLLDRYLISRLLLLFCLCFSAFAGLYVVIDGIVRFSSFRSAPNPMAAMARHYLLNFPELFVFTAPILFSLVCVFTLMGLKKNSQLIALHAGGIPLQRLVRSLTFSALLLAVAVAVIQNGLNPLCRKKLMFFGNDNPFESREITKIVFRDRVSFPQDFHDAIQEEKVAFNLITIEKLSFPSKKIQGFHIILFNTEGDPFLKIYAPDAVWLDGGRFEMPVAHLRPLSTGVPTIKSLSNWIVRDKEVRLNLPLQSAFYARLDRHAFRMDELEPFLADETFDASLHAEYFLRFIQPFYPLFFAVVGLSLALPVMRISLAGSAFSVLGTSTLMLGVVQFLETQLQNREMALDVMVISLVLSSVIFSWIGRKYYLT